MQSSMLKSWTGFRANCAAPRPAQRRAAVQQRGQLSVRAAVVAAPAELEVKSLEGEDKGTATLSLKVAEESAKGLVHRYLVYAQQNARRGTASTLTRSEVRGGGRKPYKQKGSGNARRGSRRSPLMPGGGISFGPKPRDWTIDMNKKERRLALATALQSAAADIVVVDDFSGFNEIKTKSLLAKLENVGVSQDENTLLILSEPNQNVYLSARNVEKLAINTAGAVQIYDVLRADRIVLERSALAYISEFYGAAAAEA